eukprot:SAG11_NODE_474_length_9142_cov_6.507907_15_plen_277_part_00
MPGVNTRALALAHLDGNGAGPPAKEKVKIPASLPASDEKVEHTGHILNMWKVRQHKVGLVWRSNTFWSMFVYIAFLIIFVILSSRVPPPPLVARYQTAIDDLFLGEEFDDVSFYKAYGDVESVEELWQWLEGPIVGGIGDYGSIPTLIGLNQILGPLRLRTIRTGEVMCKRKIRTGEFLDPNNVAGGNRLCTAYWTPGDDEFGHEFDEYFFPVTTEDSCANAFGDDDGVYDPGDCQPGWNLTSFPHLNLLLEKQREAYAKRGCGTAALDDGECHRQ